MLEIFMLYLSIAHRINFLQLGRFSRYGEQRFRRQFEKKFDFFSFNQSPCMPFIGSRCALAFDPSFFPKSGKHTPGLGYFWSGCASKSLRGLDILGLFVIDANSRMSFHLEAVQTPAVDTLQDNGLTLCGWYAAVIEKQIEKILSITRYAVADAFFSKKPFVDKILEMKLHLVSRLRDDADLKYLSCKSPTGKRGRPCQYGEKVDINNLDLTHFTVLENNRGTKAWTGMVYCKSLKRNIKVVVEEFIIKNKTTRRILFSTDTGQESIDIQDIYHTRFQLEFGFRDAKQFTGLENGQARSGNKLYFHFNTALTAVNLAKVMQLKDKERRELPFSMSGLVKPCFTTYYYYSDFMTSSAFARIARKIRKFLRNYYYSAQWPHKEWIILNELLSLEKLIKTILSCSGLIRCKRVSVHLLFF